MTVQIENQPTAPLRASSRRHAAVTYLLSRVNYERADALPYSERTLKLTRMRELLRRLGQPAAGIPIVHVAGTKGKGSTAAMIASMLTAAGCRTGLFSSPHLDRIEERFCVDGTRCSGDQLADLVDQVRPAVAQMDAAAPAGESGPTYFELTTAIAVLHFAAERVDAAVLEVGLGGRLDSTNVCEPDICVITNISLDHTEQLGKSLAAIAGEKAGIIKPGIPVVSGVLDPTPQAVIAEHARRHGAPLIQLQDDFFFRFTPPRSAGRPDALGKLDYFESPGKSVATQTNPATLDGLPAPELANTSGTAPVHVFSEVAIPLLGRHQAANAAVAIAVVRQLKRQGWSIDADAIRGGLLAVRLPARVEILGHRPMTIVDAAHNVASARALVDALQAVAVTGTRTVLFAATIGKDIRGMLDVLLPYFDRVVVTQYQNNPRAMPTQELVTWIEQASQSLGLERTGSVFVFPTPTDAWRFVVQTSGEEDLICSTGSFFLAAEIRALILNDLRRC